MKQCKTLPFMFLRSMFVLFLSCLSVNTLGQSLTVSGTVTDEKGEPIIGASVLVIPMVVLPTLTVFLLSTM